MFRLIILSALTLYDCEALNRYSCRRTRLPLLFKSPVSQLQDKSTTFNNFDKLFFDVFASSVAVEMNSTTPETYSNLISMINYMALSNYSPDKMSQTHDKAKSIIMRIFPPFLLPIYKQTFAKFPQFSAWMNTWVTHYTTAWLMGNSTVIDLEVIDSTTGQSVILKEQVLFIEKCAFLEESKCLRTCVHACKMPTQRFFQEEMGLPVFLRPNVTDLSCRFEFGVFPPPTLKEDEIYPNSCISVCSTFCTSSLSLKENQCL